MKPPISNAADTLGGTAVFIGTRVPVQTLLDYLEAGETTDAFLDGLPWWCFAHVPIADLKPLVPGLLRVLSTVQPGAVTLVEG